MLRKRESELAELSRVRLFSHCTERELRMIRSMTTALRIPAGQMLCTEGARGIECFVLISGDAVVRVAGQHVTTLGAGEFFGETALLGDGRRIASVEAGSDLQVLVLTEQEFRRLLVDVPRVTLHMLEGMAGKLRRATASAVAA
jgi:CRP-like cAMP-binding protein